MPSITQTIPNYVSGISEQPDELKTPGQLTVAKNVLPDVTQGLLKRPGGKLIGGDLGAYTTDSKWFHYYRDETEQYIGQIGRIGQVKMWRCSDGQPMTVTNNILTASKVGNCSRDSNGVWTINITNPSSHGLAVDDGVFCMFTSNNSRDNYYKVIEIVDADTFKVQDTETSVVSSDFINVWDNYLAHGNDQDIQLNQPDLQKLL